MPRNENRRTGSGEYARSNNGLKGKLLSAYMQDLVLRDRHSHRLLSVLHLRRRNHIRSAPAATNRTLPYATRPNGTAHIWSVIIMGKCTS